MSSNSTKQAIDHNGNAERFQAAFTSYVFAEEQPDGVELATAYSKVHVGKRPTVQAEAMGSILTGGVPFDNERLGAALNVLTQASELADRTRANTIDPTVVAMERIVAMETVIAGLRSAFSRTALDDVQVDADNVAKLVGRFTEVCNKGTGTSERAHHKDTIKAMIADGVLVAGDKLVGGKDGTFKATIKPEGIYANGKAYGSPSTAAEAVSKATHNGWVFWSVVRDGKPVVLDTLRRK